MATIKDVARAAGVSLATVSKYINGGNVRDENARAIRDAIQALDYRVNPFARSLKTQRSRSIGVLLPDISAPFFGTVVTALDRYLREHGYHTLISCYNSNHAMERDNLRFLISAGIDGLIYIPEYLSAEEYHELTANCNVPVVQMDRMVQGLDSDTVLVDNADAVYNATALLIEKGHRRIAMISGPKYVFTAKERQVGYLRALSDHDILFEDCWFINGEHSFATGYTGCQQLLDLSDRPTAIISTNYDITIGLFTAARERGLRIPDDIDVFGFDCVDVCTMMKPPLPVIYQPEQLMGQTAAKCLVQRLEGYTGAPRLTRLKCRVITG
ncbi:MAG: LacI family transcriptional regulator [Ruminococcaceae bacterium]|nr:LacI family transcriptional regulator [Oscillospiraceae bacterium]